MMNVKDELFLLRDAGYRDFQIKLFPTVDPETVIGVRTPELRELAKRMIREGSADAFLAILPHDYFDENQLHAFILSAMKDFRACLDGVKRFLPFIDNWATCDQLSPKVFAKHREELIGDVLLWTASDHTYTIRFGIGMLMQHYLRDAFDASYPEIVARIRSGEYYVNMMRAWYFATALAARWDEILPYIESEKLDEWTRRKTIQKACESYRITPEQKELLRELRCCLNSSAVYTMTCFSL